MKIFHLIETTKIKRMNASTQQFKDQGSGFYIIIHYFICLKNFTRKLERMKQFIPFVANIATKSKKM